MDLMPLAPMGCPLCRRANAGIDVRLICVGTFSDVSSSLDSCLPLCHTSSLVGSQLSRTKHSCKALDQREKTHSAFLFELPVSLE